VNRARRSAVGVAAVALLALTGLPATPAADAASLPDPMPPRAAPLTGGAGEIVMRGTTFDLAAVGYTATEWLVSGQASAYTNVGSLDPSGRWRVHRSSVAPFTTRIVVYRPTDPERFSGTTAVEWLNVSAGIDHAPTWVLVHTAAIARGDAWVGVSAQVAGIDGVGSRIGGLAATAVEDPQRYGKLHLPSDSYSYDVFSQVGRLARAADGPTNGPANGPANGPSDVLGGLTTTSLLAIGQSQSAMRLTTYIDAVQPRDHVYDGFFVHSRGGSGAPLSQAPQPDVRAPSPTRIRRDLEVPVLVFTSESDLFGLGAFAASQPDSAHYRDWQVAGTSHFDAYGFSLGRSDDGDGRADAALFDAMHRPTSALTGDFTECDAPINAGPHHYVAAAAYAALARWVAEGTPPARAPRLRVRAGATDLARDRYGNALGGIRTPHVDAPIATVSGSGNGGGCSLYGTTTAFDHATLAARYPSHEAFVDEWDTATDRATAAGFLLPIDAAHLRDAARSSTIGD